MDGILGSLVWDKELASNRADVWFMDDFFWGSEEASVCMYLLEGWISLLIH